MCVNHERCVLSFRGDRFERARRERGGEWGGRKEGSFHSFGNRILREAGNNNKQNEPSLSVLCNLSQIRMSLIKLARRDKHHSPGIQGSIAEGRKRTSRISDGALDFQGGQS